MLNPEDKDQQNVIEVPEEFSILDLEGGLSRLNSALLSTPESKHHREMQAAQERHKRHMERRKFLFDSSMEKNKVCHDRITNYAILTIISVLFIAAVGTLAYIASNHSERDPLRREAISLLAPLTGLALGFLSGKIKWPVL